MRPATYYAGKLVLASVLFLATIQLISSLFAMPTTTEFFSALYTYARGANFVQDIAVTMARCGLGWMVGFLLGSLAGIATGRLQFLDYTFTSYFNLLRSIPFICMVPLSVRFFGFDELGKWFTVGWAVFFVAWIGVHNLASNLPAEYIAKRKALRLSRLDWYRFGVVGNIKEPLLGIARTTLLIGLVVTAVAELAGAYDRSSGLFWSEGLGYRMFRAMNQGDDGMLLATIACFSILGAAIDALLLSCVSGCGSLALRLRVERVKRLLGKVSLAGTDLAARRSQEIGPRILVEAYGVDYEGKAIFRNVEFAVEPGEVLAILARSGAGKSTLLAAIACNLPKTANTSGHISFVDEGGQAFSPHIGIVFQNSQNFASLTVWENAKIGRTLRGSPCDREVAATLAAFGLLSIADQPASSLSGGQAQRLALASSILTKPDVLLLDEPLASLDAITREELVEFFNSVYRNSRAPTCIWVTHSVDEALTVAESLMVGVAPGAEMLANPEMKISDWRLRPLYLQRRAKVLDLL